MGLKLGLSKDIPEWIEIRTFVKDNPVPVDILQRTLLCRVICNKSVVGGEDNVNVCQSRMQLLSTYAMVFYGFKSTIQMTVVTLAHRSGLIELNIRVHLDFLQPLMD